jgi:hypothetical protein
MSWHFYAILGTNLLTRCHSASSLFSTVFMFQKSYTGNILGIGRNKFWNSYFSWTKDEDQTGAGEGPGAAHTTGGAWPSPWPRPPIVRPPWSPPDDTPLPISSLPTENPRGIGVFSQNSSVVPPSSKTNFGGQKSLFRHPTGTGKCPRSHFHRRLRNLHQPCCLL